MSEEYWLTHKTSHYSVEKPKKRDRPSKKPYKVSLILGETTTSGAGATLFEALQALPKPLKITSKGVLLVEGNGKSFERLYQPSQLKRFFWPIAQAVNAKVLLATIS